MKFFILLLFFVGIGTVAQAQTGSKIDLSVYPNPATEFIYIEDAKEAVSYVALYSLVGKKEREFECNVKGEQYWIADLPKGIYMVQLLGRNRSVITTQKIQKR